MSGLLPEPKVITDMNAQEDKFADNFPPSIPDSNESNMLILKLSLRRRRGTG